MSDRNTRDSGQPNSFFIRRLFVQDLFGRYTYDLSLGKLRPDKPSRVMILYGDNGSGKTTLLQMLFHLIHPAKSSGHRSFLGRTIFRQFVIELSDGSLVSAQRTGETLVGGYRMTVRLPGQAEKSVDWLAAGDGAIKGTSEGDVAELEFMKYLSGLNIGLYFLSDNRRIFTTRHYDEYEEVSPDYISVHDLPPTTVEQPSRLRRVVERLETKSSEAAIELTVYRASSWATQQVLRATTKGDEDANVIFTEIVERIVKHHGSKQARPNQSTARNLISELKALDQRSLKFSRYGLIAPIDITSLAKSIESANAGALVTINDVLRPYMDGLTARLNALQRAHDSIDSLVGFVNSFFSDKKVEFLLGRGLTVATTTGQTLSPGSLSSGERQLLLLFSNLFIVSGQNSIFIVDEPELSLNVKWQRQLVKHLLDFTEQSNVQFIFATHSIELLARYKDHVLRLTSASQPSLQ